MLVSGTMPEDGTLVTLKDIARRLDLSITQVSRALNKHADVSEATRLRVEKTANELKYQPNISARKLVSGRSGMVGLVVRRDAGLPPDALFLETVSGLSAQFSGRGMQFVLHIATGEEDDLSIYQRLTGSRALDGFVLTEPKDNDPRIAYLAGLGIPFVVHGRAAQKADYPFFDIDNRQLSLESTGYLTGHGHRRIALINGVEGSAYSTARRQGYLAALADAGIRMRPELIFHGTMDEALGLIATVRMFSAEPPHPTAVLCGNILIAKGVYRALDSLRLRIPGDVSVIAHDDDLPNLHPSEFFPALTVTHSPLRESWRPLTDFLAGAVEGQPLEALQRTAPHQFVPAASVAPPPGQTRTRALPKGPVQENH